MEKYSSEVLTSIKHVSAEEWNEVIAGAATIRHEVLEMYESSKVGNKVGRYFLVRDKNSCLQAVAVAMYIDKASRFGAEGHVFGRFAFKHHVFRNLLRPAILCGLLGHGSPVYVRSKENETLWVKRVIDVIGAYAQKHNYSIGFSSVLSNQKTLINELRAHKYLQAYSLPEAKATITWNDKESYLLYLRSLNKNYHKTAKFEMRRFIKSNISIAEWDGNNISEIHNLLKKHHNERNDVKFEFTAEDIVKLNIKLGNDFKIYTAKRKDILVGVIILLKSEEIAWAWKIGVDHVADKNCFTYFNIAYYFLLSSSLVSNIKTIWYGNAALYAKIKRGCKIEFTYFYYKPAKIYWKPTYYVLFLFQRFWYQKKFSPYIEACK